ncbi:hypothetical protein GCM10022416_22170 [Actinomadura keratinilytica]|jgi:hypothetical protein|uniref:Transposase IS116/IS110/IS902 C-terminal domain-containing protein n=1 Tax=Actinomadura keratinilytica TaxID=547461 RepID=A0ABP7YKL4_9ACTN
MAADAGLTPVSQISGTSIRGERPPKGGNKHLKRAIFTAAFTSLSAPPTTSANAIRTSATTPP